MKQQLTCRAEVSDDCQKSWEANEEEQTDSTRRGGTVVCNACYLILEPFMRMNRNVPEEVDQAHEHYRVNLRHVQQHQNPQALVFEAERKASTARPGSPMHISALACVALAKAEVERRTEV